MRNKSLIIGFLLPLIAATLPQAGVAAEPAAPTQVTERDLSGPPDATIDFSAKQLRLLVGGAKGKGVLHFNGKNYPFTAKGATIGGIGYTKVEGTGNVYFLKKLEDFPGTYGGIGAGAAVIASKGASSFQNMKEVVITTKSKGDGLALNLGVSAITVKLGK